MMDIRAAMELVLRVQPTSLTGLIDLDSGQL